MARGGRRARLVWALCALGAAAGAEPVRLPDPGTGAWQPLPLRGVERETRYTPVRVDGIRAVRAESDCSASGLTLPLGDIDLQATPRLRWRWRVDHAPQTVDPRVKEGDDFAARVYVLFPFVAARASVWERLRYRAGVTLFGENLPGGALNYVWTRREPAGTRWDNPFTRQSKMISAGAGPLAQWQWVDVDVAEDHRSLFGSEPPAPVALALMSDSDNSCQRAEALFADFRFAAAGSEAPSGRSARPARRIGMRSGHGEAP
ncbi:MAG: DUF3047 domain-containing protein [Deltaproteobacteria bacterium]|nr:MAG: DUF3047 domain-containing protein [Deltaproteobacteria bacterium]